GSDGFRIVNNMLFYVTDEEHDDGEAYGGSMRDLMVAAIQKMGRDGLMKIGDLTMETMRLTRDHPGLTAPEWFGHMVFADSLGRAGVRAPGELHDLILGAVGKRNFTLDGTAPAALHLRKGQDEII